jgi:hypothetical protein
VADSHPVADDRRRLSIGDVNYRSVLDIRVVTDANVEAIAAQHAVVPDAGMLADVDVAYDTGVIGNEGRCRDLWNDALIWSDHIHVR